jgi:hypothetical protein
MNHDLLDSYPLGRIDHKNLLKQIYQIFILPLQDLTKGLLSLYVHRFNYRLRSLASHKVQLLSGRFSSELEYFFKLVDRRCSLEDRLSYENLSKNAAQAPDINGLAVVASTKQNLRRPVPPRSYVLSKCQLLRRIAGHKGADKSKITDLNFATLIDEDI